MSFTDEERKTLEDAIDFMRHFINRESRDHSKPDSWIELFYKDELKTIRNLEKMLYFGGD